MSKTFSLPTGPVSDDERLLELVTFLSPSSIDAASLGVFWVDADDQPTQVITQFDGLPTVPDPAGTAGLTTVLRGICDELGPGFGVVLMLQRPGAATVREDDRAWNTALRDAARGKGVRVRELFLVTPEAVRPLTLDDAA